VDQFQWLKLPGNTNFLTKQIRQHVVSLLDVKENKDFIERFLKTQDGDQPSDPENGKVSLPYRKLDDFKFNKKKSKMSNTGDLTNPNCHMCNSDGGPAPDLKKDTDYRVGNIGEDTQLELKKLFAAKQHVKMPKGNHSWSKTKEDSYINAIKTLGDAHNESSGPNNHYVNIGLFFMIREINVLDKTKNLREDLLDKYIDGNQLEEAELKYLALTSPTLNMFLDKKFYQRKVNFIETEFYNSIETQLVNRIILSYVQTKSLLMMDRTNWLTEKLAVDLRRKFGSTVPDLSHHSAVYHSHRFGKMLSKRIRCLTAQAKDSGDVAKSLVLKSGRFEKSPFLARVLAKQSREEPVSTHLFGQTNRIDYFRKFHPNSSVLLGSNFAERQCEALKKPIKVTDGNFFS
jgi:hypothetical protein